MEWMKRIERRTPHSISYVKGTDVKVLRVVYMLASGWSFSQILREHPQLCPLDIKACLQYAGMTADNEYEQREIPAIVATDEETHELEEAERQDAETKEDADSTDSARRGRSLFELVQK